MVTNYHQSSGDPLQPSTVSPRIFRFLKRYADNLPDHEKLVILSFTDFPFRDFVPMTKSGYNGGEKLPSHFIVPCIRFVVSRKFHLLGSLFFHAEYLSRKPEKFGKDMAECMKLYILALNNIGLRVIATICPLTSVFHRAVEILTKVQSLEDYEGPLVYSVGSIPEIVHLHDPKYIRDGFLRLFMLFDLRFKLNGKEFDASRYDIIDALEMNSKLPFLHKATSNSKYYNQLSYYYFTEELSLTIRKMIKQGSLGSQAIGTSIFINMFRQLLHRIYGLNDEDCEIFDFSRMNEYIEFINSIHPIPSTYVTENYQQDIAGSLPSVRRNKTGRDINALERFVNSTPSTYSGLYTQAETPIQSLQPKNMYEPVIISTSSGKTYVPVDHPVLENTSKSKNKKKSKRERKKQLKKTKMSEQERSIDTLMSDPKDDLLLISKLAENTKSPEEMPLLIPSEEDNTCVDSNPESIRERKQQFKRDEKQSRPMLVTESERKILSPVQNIAVSSRDPNTEITNKNNKNLDLAAFGNLNLNENIRKYTNMNKSNLGAVRKIDLDDESNKENITRNFITNITRQRQLNIATKEVDNSALNTATEKMNKINLDEEINEISYTISDFDDTTEYRFEENLSKTESLDEACGGPQDDEKVFTKDTPDQVGSTNMSKEQVINLIGADTNAENEPKFDAFVQYLKDRNSQYTAKLNETKEVKPQPRSSKDMVKISMKGNDRVDIERVSAESIQPPPLDLFGISRHTWEEPITKPEATENEKSELTTFKVSAILTDRFGNTVATSSEHGVKIKKKGKRKNKSKPSKKNLARLISAGIERVSKSISTGDPLKISENSQIIKPSNTRTCVDATLASKSSSSTPRSTIASSGNLPSSSTDAEDSILSDVAKCCGYDWRERTSSISEPIGTGSEAENKSKIDKLNNEFPNEPRVPFTQIPRIHNPMENPRRNTRRYISINTGCSSDSEGDFEIIDRTGDDIDTEYNENRETYEMFPREFTESSAPPEFNSEYDDFDDMVINKHVKMIINKLEEKDEQIARLMNRPNVEDPDTSSTEKDPSTKRGFIKKEIYPEGENSKTGATKRTIFHREKTEESQDTPTNVIENSENICDKSKIASTKASYNETLGIKSKKQLAKLRDEQCKKIAITLSQTFKKYSNIFNLPDSEEEKSVKISQASLNFIYDLKKFNEAVDVETKQKHFNEAYSRLCVAILGHNAGNKQIQHKMRELIPILQEIASSKETSDSAAKKILSQHVDKTISPAELENEPGPSRYVRESVQSLWINNIRGIERLFRRLGSEKIYFDLSTELFRTEHVDHIMNFIQANGPRVDSFFPDDRCQPLNLPECFDTLKPHGSVMLVED